MRFNITSDAAWSKLAFAGNRIRVVTGFHPEITHFSRTMLELEISLSCVFTSMLTCRGTSIVLGRGSAPVCLPIGAVGEVLLMCTISAFLNSFVKGIYPLLYSLRPKASSQLRARLLNAVIVEVWTTSSL